MHTELNMNKRFFLKTAVYLYVIVLSLVLAFLIAQAVYLSYEPVFNKVSDMTTLTWLFLGSIVLLTMIFSVSILYLKDKVELRLNIIQKLIFAFLTSLIITKLFMATGTKYNPMMELGGLFYYLMLFPGTFIVFVLVLTCLSAKGLKSEEKSRTELSGD